MSSEAGLHERIRYLEQALEGERRRAAAARDDARREMAGLTAELELRVAERTAELAQERARLATLLEQMPVGIVLTSPAGELLLANRHVERILGREAPAQALGSGEIYSFHLDGRRYEPDELVAARVLRGEAPVIREVCEYERPDGTRIVVEISSSVVRARDGAPSGVVTMFEDITAKGRRERAEREFVTNAAHELQSPIAAVLAAAEALAAGAKDDPVQRERFIGHITDAANRLARLTNALLVLARVQTGVEPAKRSVVPLSPLLYAVAGATPVAPGVTLSVDCSAEEGAIAHPGLLEQAVANLLDNAAKHTAAGTIVIGASRVGGRVHISVVDTGSGIVAADQERVRKRFVRLDGDRGGFGLGLAITDQAVQAMDGELMIESTPGRGTSATIVLPAASVVSR